MFTRRRFAGMMGAAAGLAASPLATPARAAADTIVIPFRVRCGTPWTPVRIGGSEAFPFAISTSNGLFMMDPAVAKRMHADPTRADGGFTPVYDVVVADRLSIRSHVGFVAPHYAAERPVAGSFGLNLFRNWAVDWDRQEVTLTRAAPPRERALKGVATEGYADLHRHAWPVARVEIDGRPLRLLIETDLPYGVVLKPDAPLMAWGRGFAARRENFDRDGASAGITLRASSLKLGAVEVKQPLVTVGGYLETGAIGGSHRKGDWKIAADGVMGFDFARRFNLVSDTEIEELRVTPSLQLGDAQADDRAGVMLEHLPGRYRVLRIDPKGAAFDAGLRAGDAIVDCHGEDGLAGLAWSFTRPAATRVAISVDRGGTPLEMTVELRDRV